jgi:hypothetical protein
MSDWSPWFRLVAAVLATWRLAHLIAREDGPFDLVVRIRVRAGDGFLGQLMDCPYCLSIWFAIPFAFTLANSLPAWLIAWLAISGGASLFERFAGPPAGTVTDISTLLKEDEHDLLRR